ncbi:MAG: class I SAM-dependent methyltransferase [Gemmatimonadales bacterium]
MHHRRETCRACGGTTLTPFLSLGPQPLANSFLKSPDEARTESWFPLDVYLCETCSLVQLLDVIDPEVLFRDYVYMTGMSTTIAIHNADYAARVGGLLELEPGDLVVEAASNDGSLLQCFAKHGVRTLGVEPARNIATIARAAGIDTLDLFFNVETAHRIRSRYGPARAVIGNNVLAHVDDTRGFLRGCADLIADDGQAITEVPYLGDFIDRLEYDTVYHEHLCYFSVTSLMRLAEETGLRIVRIERYPIHGGTIRMYAAPARVVADHAESVRVMADAERAAGLTTLPRFTRFAADVEKNRREVVTTLTDLKAAGKTVAGYGAPAKGNTLLNYCRIGPDLLPYTVDKSPLKVGKLTPGTHIPVLPVDTLLARQPDYVLILAWNFAAEIMAQQAEYHRRGGRFIVPVPTPTVCQAP